MNREKLIFYGYSIVFIFFSGINGFLQGMYNVYDPNIMPRFYPEKRFQWYATVQKGVAHTAYSENCKTNALRIWQLEQNVLTMLDGVENSTPAGVQRMLLDATDDGVRGHIAPYGTLNLQWAAYTTAVLRCAPDWTIRFTLPFYATQLSDVSWNDKTDWLTEADMRVREYIRKEFFNQVTVLGNGLSLEGWKRMGLGDGKIAGEWNHDFPQIKPFLKNVHLSGRVQLTLPTGKTEDIDKLQAFAFGNDGAWGLSSIVGFDLSLSDHVIAGFDVQLTHIFGNSRLRRIKIDEQQTDLLLLQKACVYKDFGLEHHFNVYAQLINMYGFAGKIGYQFFKHGEDTYTVLGNNFSSIIANSAERLQEWTIHHLIASLSYTYKRDHGCIPQCELFVKLPIQGKRALSSTTVGCVVSIEF